MRCSVQPSGQWSPVAVGPLSTLHLRRSNSPRWPLASDVQNTPLRSMSAPRAAIARHRRRIDLGELRLRIEAHGIAAATDSSDCPHTVPSSGLTHDAVEADRDALVLRRIDRLIGLDPFVALAVAVGVEHERRPALRALHVAGLFQHPAIDPAGHARAGAAAREPQRVVGVLGEDQVMGREAGVDQRELAGRRIEHRHVPRRAVDREHLGRRMIRALAAERRIGGRTQAHREPRTALLVHHRVVRVGLRVPDRLVAPVGRRRHRIGAVRRRLRIEHRMTDRRTRCASPDRGSARGRMSSRASRRSCRWR